MTPNETEAQIDAENKANANKNVQAETDSKSLSNNQEQTDHPSNILDFPITKNDEDSIGIDRIKDGMVEYINHADMPFTIAVQGEWGIGKTSFLKLLKTKLCENDDSLYYSVWIDACDFTLLQSPISAVINMLQSMIYQIGQLKPVVATEQQGKEYIEKAALVMKNLGKYAAKKLITSGAKVATSGIISEDMVDELADVITSSWSTNNKQNSSQDSNLSAIKQLQGDIASLIKEILDPNNDENHILSQQTTTQPTAIKTNDNRCGFCNLFKSPKISTINNNNQKSKESIKNSYRCTKIVKKRGIVFFIDNLDRIDPTLSIEILEITKNIFDFSNSVFIIALDKNIALRGLQAKLGELKPGNKYTFNAYFDKFVQQSISLPNQLTAISELLFKSLVHVNYFNEIELMSPKHFIIKSNNTGKLISSHKTLKDILFEFSYYSSYFNPRYIKRFVNTLSLILHIMKTQPSQAKNGFLKFKTSTRPVDTTTKALLFIVMNIETSFFDMYKIMASPKFISQLQPDHFTGKSVLDNLKSEFYKALNNKKSVIEYREDRAERVILTLKSIENMDQSIIGFNEKLSRVIEVLLLCEQESIF